MHFQHLTPDMEKIVSVRRRIVVACVALSVLAPRVAPAQRDPVSAVRIDSPPAGLVLAEPNGANAPLLRLVIALDLRDVPLSTALRELSRHMGGRLMYDESVSAIPRRVTLQSAQVSAGSALRRMLEGTDVEIFVSQGSQGGQLVLLKRVMPAVASADSMPITGRVIDAATSLPIPQVVVSIGGSSVRVLTGEDGRFVMPNVPPGSHILTFRRLGYAPGRQAVTVAAGQRDASVSVTLTPVASQLNQVVTTGTGDRAMLEIGHSSTSIDAEKEVERNAYQDLSDLLANRGNGLSTMSGGGSPNSQTRNRIRGINSINANNDPIVIIDGIRAASGYPSCRGSIGSGNLVGCNNVPSRFDDIDVNDIESIEILKGPSAAALWGSEASNGVIVIKTKRGRAGPTRWTVTYDEGFSSAPTDLRIPMQGLGTPPNGTSVFSCTLLDQALGRCVPIDSVAGGFNLFADPRTTPMATGRQTDVNVSAAGGGETMQFYFSGGYRNDLGTAKMPETDRRLVRQALGQSLPGWMKRPDSKNSGNVVGRLTGQFSDNADYAITTNFIQIDSRTGGDGVMGGTGDPRSEADTLTLSSAFNKFYVERKHRTNRFIGGLSLNWRPVTWFSGNAVVGRDYAFMQGGEYARRNWCLPFCATTSREASGQVNHGESRQMVQTVNLGGVFTVPVPGRTTVLRTAVGAQHTRSWDHDFGGSGYDLPVGRVDVTAAPSANRTATQSSDDRATFGMYVQQTVGFRERLFVNAALRRDLGSSLGREVAPLYPKWDASWLASEEPFFAGLREKGVSLRLRGAFGHAGVQPTTSAKFRTFSQLPRFVDPITGFGDNYALLNGVGNADLRPERSVEREGGFELGLWDDRVTTHFTAFHKFTEDAIISRILAPSIGLGSTTRQQYNVGNVRNTGVETGVTARILDQPNLQWLLTVAYASRRNKLVSLGAGVEPFSISASNANLATTKDDDGIVMPGYPLFGRWARPILGYSDANLDGIITPDEVKLSDTLVFIGPSQPKADMAVVPEFAFWNGRIRMSADFSYIHGLTQVNTWAASSRFFTTEAYDPSTSLRDQACIVAASSHQDEFCYYETVNVFRLENMSLSFAAPDRFAQMVRAQSASFALTGSNLGLWSGYKGYDPTVNTEDASGNRTLGGAVVPEGRTWTLRARLTF